MKKSKPIKAWAIMTHGRYDVYEYVTEGECKTILDLDYDITEAKIVRVEIREVGK